MIINKESIEKVINKHFNPLEDKTDKITKELVLKEIENLPPIEDEHVDEDIISKRNTVKEYLKGNLKELGSAEKVGTEDPYEFKVVILENFRILYIKKDDINHPVPVGIWLDLWERDHSAYFGIREYKYKELPINKRANLESQLQLYLWANKEYYINYTEFYLPKEYDRWFDEINLLCDKRKDFWSCMNDHFKQKLQKRESQLTGSDIFDITTTGMSYYDAMIQKGHIAGNRDPVEYFKTNKGLVFEIEWMSPEDYINKSIDIRYPTPNNVFVKEEVMESINRENVNEYIERTLSGSKMPMPVLDYNDMSQEGRHRTVVAQQLNIEEIPVLIVKPYEE